ncbi:tyrosine-type recombinase/integrase [Pseudomonas coronafaciens]|uniref:tyrosine-type recombinase/integrase n=1 Tax=Pseudomonas coronafaciens TaxID=53409 RepID=UPI0006AB787D|nr:tyrosine-type recombinase/integrase [Pseudomonas coronafaciens]KOP52584.1 integrase [Pseudomonas coronafaciens pv. porri]KPY22983.1 Phage integrase family site specific recombinase [Pseudomonas coronafaciens pv. porri]RMV95417.1 Phage integrase family site specific recombinase [Pseudomonas coronafaciens pv. porri]RMW12056.1 Phage integrase family site specific recombinase [Pseudomonas coronafaciens pv. porri]
MSYVPFDVDHYERQEELSDLERTILSNRRYRSDWAYLQSSVPRLIIPLIDLVVHAGVSDRLAVSSVSVILWHVSKTDTPYWSWSEMQWLALLDTRAGSRPYLAAVAYHLGGFRTPQRITKFRQSAIYASFIFGHEIFKDELTRLSTVLKSLGYTARHLEKFLSGVLGVLMLENGDPRLETFTEGLLIKGQGHRSVGIARLVGKVSHGLAALGILDKPLRKRGYVDWREKSIEGIDSVWVSWCRRWRDTSTLRPRTRESNYSFMLRTGIWLTREQPWVSSPVDWNTSTCAAVIAAIDRMTVGEWALESALGTKLKGLGQPIAPNSKRAFLHALRRFFIDFELWGWGRLKFSPRHHLATPRTVAFNSGINPRVIDDSSWLKLVWASLNLERKDLLSEIHYPLAMVQAAAVVWTHTGLRSNEIMRLSMGCAHAQPHEVVHEDGTTIPPGTLCYLDIPASKTFKAFVKPVAVVVKERIDAWLKERPVNQAPLLDERTGEKVSYLFQFRGKRMGAGVINRKIIPILCAKAGVPLDDSRGRITSHRGRASVVTALASVPQGMSLMELMQWSGHSSPSSTLHYIRIRPTKLAASFVKADQMSHMVSVLIDHDVIARRSSDPYTFYDLGDSYCSNPFWSSCPHRMACAGCDFNIPKASARAQALESKASIGHYLEAVPLTADERAIVEGDLEKLDGLIRKLDDVPTLDGRTPSQIDASKGR